MLATHCAFIALVLCAPAVHAQVNPDNIPQPPTTELMRLRPFLGSYAITGTYLDLEWAGSLDVRPAVKGWYVEWEIDVHSGPIDRQLRQMFTFDADAGHYRVWRFETLPPSPAERAEGTGRFVGGEFVTEWNDPHPDGRPGTFRNRARMDGSDILVIVSEWEPASGGEVVRIGVTTARRRL